MVGVFMFKTAWTRWVRLEHKGANDGMSVQKTTG